MKHKTGTLVITRELFKETIEALEKQHAHDRKCSDAFGVILPNDFTSGYDNNFISNQLRKLLKLSFKDDHRDSWIDYFIYDMDFGRDYKEGSITDKNGNNTPLGTTDDLYDLLNE